ncbi:MAG: hypothetical protein GY915_06240 [bacterium]|nr:hypothetical protein [bacterium]
MLLDPQFFGVNGAAEGAQNNGAGGMQDIPTFHDNDYDLLQVFSGHIDE